MAATSAFPFVDVHGTPYERGCQHGAAVPERIARSVALYRGQLERRGVGIDALHALARDMLPVIERYGAAYLQELRGIADGAGVPVEDVVVINCRTEMMFGQAQLGRARQALDDGCTALVVLPGRAAAGRLMHAHNWDWREECVDTGIVLRMRREDGPDLLMFTEAGSLARHGFNSAGVSLTGNFLSCERDYRRPGQVPLVLVRRKMLEATNICNAMKVLWATHRYCSNNLMLAQAQGEAVNLECAPDEIFWLVPQDDVLVHANHWISPPARAKLVDTGLAANPDSLYRQRRVEAALGAAGPAIGWDAVRNVLADGFAAPDGVLRSPKPASYDSISATVATTLMEPSSGVMWIARQPYVSREFAEYRLF